MPKENKGIAPRILRNGEPALSPRDKKQSALMVDNAFWYEVFKMTNTRSKNDFGVMMLLLGSAQDGSFQLPAQTAIERLGMSQSSYYESIKRLEDLKLISCSKGKSITINTDMIWEKVRSKTKNSGTPENSSPG